MNLRIPMLPVCLWMLSIPFLFAQLPMCDSLPAYYCQTTPFCQVDDLDGTCYEMVDHGTGPEVWPGCANSLDNPHWLTFVAGVRQTVIMVEVGNCVNGNGIQLGVFEMSCAIRFGLAGDSCQSNGVGQSIFGCQFVSAPIPPGTVTTLDFATVPGQIYGILIDGWGPDLCQLAFNVLQGGDAPTLDTIVPNAIFWNDTIFPFEGDTICTGESEVLFSTEEIAGACRYLWTVDGEGTTISTFSNIELISFPISGSFEICVAASNYCDTSQQSCIVVVATDCLSGLFNQAGDDLWTLLENPVMDYVNLTGKANENIQLSIFDMNGNFYFISDYASRSTEGYRINVEGLNAGVYFLRIVSDDLDQVVVKRFIKL